MRRKPSSIDEYLENVRPDLRAALEKLRATIRAILPDAEECIAYRIPAFRVDGKVVAGFAARSTGGSYYPFSGRTLRTLAADVAKYPGTKSALHFTLEKPLPGKLVRKLLRTRIAETRGTVRPGKARRGRSGDRAPGGRNVSST